MISQEEYEQQVIDEVKAECQQYDRVYQLTKFVSFVSKSKGWYKHGLVRIYRRKRRNWVEVELFHYTNGWHTEKHFHADAYATEIIGPHADSEELLERMRSVH